MILASNNPADVAVYLGVDYVPDIEPIAIQRLQPPHLGIVVLDAELRVVEANDAFAALAGRPRGELVGVHAQQLIRQHGPRVLRVDGVNHAAHAGNGG